MKRLASVKFWIFVVLASIFLSGCIFGVKDKEPVLTSLKIAPDNLQVKTRTTQEFTVKGYDQEGKEMEEFETPEWLVDDAIGSLDTNKGHKVVFEAGDIEANGELTVTVEDLTAKATIKVVKEIIDPLAWSESFEDNEVGDFPKGWIINNKDNHADKETGPRVATDVPDIPDGEKVMKYTTNKGGNAAELYIDIPEVSNGRLEFSVYQPEGARSNFGIKPYYEDTQLINFWISAGGELRLPDRVQLKVGTWHIFKFEWSESDGKLFVYQKVDGDWVDRGESNIENVPNKISVDGGVTDKNASGALDNFKLYDLDLMPE